MIERYKLSQGGQFIVSVGATPDMSNMLVTKCPTKIARNAYKKRLANRGDAPTDTHAARYTATVCKSSSHDGVRKLARKGWR